MKCKKCGSDALIKKNDWYECAVCATATFDTDVNNSPTKEIERIELESDGQETSYNTYNPNEQSVDSTEETDKKSKEKKKKSKTHETIEFFIPIVIAVIVSILLKTFIFANAVVPTGSMLNTIQEGDKVIASRIAYQNEDPQRYDIIIFRNPDNEKIFYVKRIIGLPGETVQVVGGVVYVTKTDGETIQLDDSFVTIEKPLGDFGPYKVPKDSYFMMGDNRNNSLDSRFWTNKFVHRDKIIGKVKFKYYPGISKIE